MKDDRTQIGPMSGWPQVNAISGALAMLERLTPYHHIAIATSAADSDAGEIRAALQRVGINRFIDQIFCQSELGFGKDSPNFYPEIIARLGTNPAGVVMIGDSLANDVLPAIEHGLQAIWFNPAKQAYEGDQASLFQTIFSLNQLQPHIL